MSHLQGEGVGTETTWAAESEVSRPALCRTSLLSPAPGPPHAEVRQELLELVWLAGCSRDARIHSCMVLEAAPSKSRAVLPLKAPGRAFLASSCFWWWPATPGAPSLADATLPSLGPRVSAPPLPSLRLLRLWVHFSLFFEVTGLDPH